MEPCAVQPPGDLDGVPLELDTSLTCLAVIGLYGRKVLFSEPPSAACQQPVVPARLVPPWGNVPESVNGVAIRALVHSMHLSIISSLLLG